MTPQQQIDNNDAMHGQVTHLIDLLSLWEAMDAATTPNTAYPSASLTELRQDVGVAEVRDLCITIHPYADQVWKAYETEFDDFAGAYDWEFVPLLVQCIDWSTASYNRVPGKYRLTVELPDAATMAEAVYERRDADPVDVAGRVAREIDGEANNDRIIQVYRQASAETKAVIDDIFISLCGWSMSTLIKEEEPGQ